MMVEQHKDSLDVLYVDPEVPAMWERLIWDKCGGVCSNCGEVTRLKVCLIVPLALGGKRVPGNGTLLCRTCDLARDIVNRPGFSASGDHARPINFFVCREMYDKLKNDLLNRYGFRSVSSLIRFLMYAYVTDPDRFDDIGMYQMAGSDVKVNVWADRDVYDRFKVLADRNGSTVTATLKGLICMYEMEAGRILSVRKGVVQ